MEEGGCEVGENIIFCLLYSPFPFTTTTKATCGKSRGSTFFGNFTVPTSFGILWYFVSHRFKRNER